MVSKSSDATGSWIENEGKEQGDESRGECRINAYRKEDAVSSPLSSPERSVLSSLWTCSSPGLSTFSSLSPVSKAVSHAGDFASGV